jgi:ribonuclease P protein component
VNLRALRAGEPASRFAFTANVSVGNAVVRNRVKRRLREIARPLPVRGGWHLVLGARPGAASARFQELRAAVEELLGRAGVLEQNER